MHPVSTHRPTELATLLELEPSMNSSSGSSLSTEDIDRIEARRELKTREMGDWMRTVSE